MEKVKSGIDTSVHMPMLIVTRSPAPLSSFLRANCRYIPYPDEAAFLLERVGSQARSDRRAGVWTMRQADREGGREAGMQVESDSLILQSGFPRLSS